MKSNTTLTVLYLGGEDKRKKDTQKTSLNNSLFSFLVTPTGNNVGERGATSLSESLRINTTLTELDLSCKGKKGRYIKRRHDQ